MANLDNRVRAIELRNRNVEIDKAWETSKSRKVIITLFTYILISLYLQVINVPNPWLNGIVPALGFLLSTLTMPYLKKIWIKYLLK